MNAYANQYQNNQILNASPEQILIMLYDGAIRFTRQAILGIEENRPSMKLEGISRALAIIAEFSNTLDRDIGGEIAENLDGLYHFMMRELIVARSENSIAKLQVVEELLLDLRTTWSEAIEINRQTAMAARGPQMAGSSSVDGHRRLTVSM
jgi:flagellar protein FliS